jgi:NCS1 family nucleobase:cation symporter-1
MTDESIASARSIVQHEDGRVELVNEDGIKSSSFYNHDLAPVPVAKRNWSTYNFAALWVSMSACIPTYMLSSGLIASGMNWWQALMTILLGNIIVLIPILLNSHPGTKYGIPFPVFARAAYGTIGSNLPALMRALVACGWFGIQAWIGGQAFHTFLAAVVPGWKSLLGGPVMDHTPTEWLSFLLFWGLNIFIIYRGMDLLKKVEGFAAPFVMTMTGLLVVWARQISNHRRVYACVHSIIDGHDWVLGHSFAEHARLYALRAQPEGANNRPGGGIANGHDRLFHYGNFDYLSGSDYLSHAKNGCALGSH